MISSSPEMRLRYFKAGNSYKIAVKQSESGEVEQALLSFQEALEIFKEFQNDLLISNCFFEIGRVLNSKNQYEEALVNLRQALEIYREMKMLKEGNLAIGDAFYNKGDLKTADRYYAKGGKENKVETKEKVGKAYLEDAFKETDPKLQKKAFDNAYKALSRAYNPAEANRMIGNEFFKSKM